MEVSGGLDALAALLPGEEPLVPAGWEAGGASGLVWTLEKREIICLFCQTLIL